jgi:hypothetical protein
MDDWYGIFKYLHVSSVIIWLGGALALTILARRADRANDTPEFTRILQNVVYMSKRVFVPSALAALVFGLILFFIYSLYNFLWIYIGLIGFAVTFGVGIGFLAPRSEKVLGLINKEGTTPAAIAQAREILKVAQFDLVFLFVIVANMVLKPGWYNWITLIIMVLVVAGAGYYFLADTLRPMIEARMKMMKKT